MKRTFFLLLCTHFFFASLHSQSVTGRIVDASTGEGLEMVRMIPELSGEEFLTDENGYFSISVKEFPVTFELMKAGYFQLRITFQGGQDEKLIRLTPMAESLSEVVIQGALIPSRLKQLPAAVNVLRKADMERGDGTDFSGVLNSVPGIYVHKGALNTSKLSIRGVGARSQYSTNRVKAYFEGIPLSTAEGETTLDDLDINSLRKVEVTKGPNSSLYGVGLGGVINLYAETAEESGTSGELETTFGSYNLLKKGVRLRHSSESAHWFAGYDHLSTDSFRDNGAYDRKSLSLHTRINSGSANSLSVLANFTRLFAYIPSSISAAQMESDPSGAAFTWGASKGYESYDKGLLGFSYGTQINEILKNTTSIYMNFRDAYEPRPFDILKEDQMATGARTKFNYSTRVFALPSEFSIGAEYNREWYDSSTFENLYESFPGEGSVRGTGLSDNSQVRSYYNLFGQWNLELSEKLKLETGINVNRTSYDLTDLFLEDEVDQTGSYDFETVVSPRIAALYELTPEKNLYASISHGFSTPTVAETLTPEGLINLDLKPETGINYEIGFKADWFSRKLYSEISLYSIQVKDLLVAERIAEDRYIGRNAGRTDHNGVEIFLRSDLSLGHGLSAKPYLNAAFNFFEFERFVDDGVDHSGNDLPGVPEKTINAGVDLISDTEFSLYTSFFHSGDIPLNDANDAYSGSYELIDMKASYSHTFFEKLDLKLFAGVNNLLDEKYAASILPNAVGFGTAAPRYFYPGNPRNWYGGVGLSFNL